ncbi:cytochrome P450 9e2-like [Choristoneura fumiferana]|uniref:cytochrome P450 9e2-like n=1 Tax=Choristoneura fumiferana TaxID=7141 RepID=UPI003D1583A2
MLFLIWVVVLVLILMLCYRAVYTKFSRYGVKNLTPVPILGDMTKVTLQLEHFFDNLDKTYRSFPGERFVGSFEFTRPVVFIRDIELVKKITVKDFEHFLDHSVVIDENIDPFFGRNLFALKGQKWKDMRATLSPAFTSSKMRLMVPFMTEAGNNMINRIKKTIAESDRDYFDVDIKDLATRYANDVIASCAFGLIMDSQNVADSQFYEMGKAASQLNFIQVLKFLGFQSFPSLMKMLKVTLFTRETQNFFKELVTHAMREREEKKIHRPDMIHLLMELKKGNLAYEEDTTSTGDAGLAAVEESSVGKSSSNRVWADEDLLAQAVIFFVAGFESVAQVMTFLIYELAFNPDIQEKLVKEIRETDRKNGGRLDFTSIQEMTYLDMVMSELLRLWTPGGFMDRICTKDYNLGKPNDSASEDYIIRKGEGIKIPIWSFHRDPDYFPSPTTFDPERFSEENRHKIQPFTYSPFGVGPRNCIASRFALYEVKVMVYQLLRDVEVSACEKSRYPIKLNPSTFNLLMKGGHWLRLKIRE